MEKLLKKIKQWHTGTYVPPENDPSSDLIFVMGDYQRHWTAKAFDSIAKFFKQHWQYLITTAIAIAVFMSTK